MKLLKIIGMSLALSSAPLYAQADSLVIALTTSSVPFSYKNAEGKHDGFNLDIAKEICSKLKATCSFEYMRFPEILPKISAGTVDIGIPNMLKTPERAKKAAFTIPYWRSTSSFVSKRGSHFSSIDHAVKTQTICAISNTRQINFLKLKNGGASGKIVETKTTQETIEGLLNGRCELLLMPTMQSLTFLQAEAGVGFGYVGRPISDHGLGGNVHIIVRPDQPNLLKRVDGALKEMIRDGSHEHITRKHFPFSIL